MICFPTYLLDNKTTPIPLYLHPLLLIYRASRCLLLFDVRKIYRADAPWRSTFPHPVSTLYCMNLALVSSAISSSLLPLSPSTERSSIYSTGGLSPTDNVINPASLEVGRAMSINDGLNFVDNARILLSGIFASSAAYVFNNSFFDLIAFRATSLIDVMAVSIVLSRSISGSCGGEASASSPIFFE